MSTDKQLITVEDMDLAVLICYLYGYESLRVVEFSETGHAVWQLSAPSEDVKILEEELKRDEIQVQLLSYCKMRVRLNRTLRIAKQDGRWESVPERSDEWWEQSREQLKVKQERRG